MASRRVLSTEPAGVPPQHEAGTTLAEVAAQAAAYLDFERQMATPGLPLAPGPALSRRPAAGGQGPAVVPPRHQARRSHNVPTGGQPQTPPSQTEGRARLRVLAQEAAACSACELHEGRQRSVFARGNEGAELVFVGEGPGRDEDLQGLPFVGAAGQLLDKMVAAMGYARDDVYICNVVKCRPPNNRTPRPEEAVACSRFLKEQLAIVSPKVIVALGRCAAEHLGVAPPEGAWRGRWGEHGGIRVMPTYHPAFLLRSPQQKRVVWEDLQGVMRVLGRSPSRTKG